MPCQFHITVPYDGSNRICAESMDLVESDTVQTIQFGGERKAAWERSGGYADGLPCEKRSRPKGSNTEATTAVG